MPCCNLPLRLHRSDALDFAVRPMTVGPQPHAAGCRRDHRHPNRAAGLSDLRSGLARNLSPTRSRPARCQADGLRHPLGTFLDLGVQQFHHLGYPLGALLGPALRRADPAQIRPQIELRERVEERRSVRVGRQRGGDVVGKARQRRPGWRSVRTRFRRPARSRRGARSGHRPRAVPRGSGYPRAATRRWPRRRPSGPGRWGRSRRARR